MVFLQSVVVLIILFSSADFAALGMDAPARRSGRDRRYINHLSFLLASLPDAIARIWRLEDRSGHDYDDTITICQSATRRGTAARLLRKAFDPHLDSGQ
jgi:hypothetical protein